MHTRAKINAVGRAHAQSIRPGFSGLTLRAEPNSDADYLVSEIRRIDPSYLLQTLEPGGLPATFEGRANLINGLRADRAAALYRFRGLVEPLQVETLRFMQRRVDRAYAEGVRLYDAGRLSVRLSREEAIGNYVDGQARQALRRFYDGLRIAERRGDLVAVNRNTPRMSDGTYRRPDARVGNVVLDVTLSRKTIADAQIRAFFNSELRPDYVVIVRPSQLGPSAT